MPPLRLRRPPRRGAGRPAIRHRSIVGNYELTQVLATGRFGSIVYAGQHRMLGNPVAVRVYRPTEKDNKEAIRARFLREARALQVVHPNIIHVRDFGEQGDMMYLVTDLLPGVSLGGMVRREGHLALEKLNTFVRELSQATAAVHQHGGFISGLHPEIMRVVQENGEERLAISSAGIGGMQDLLATMDVSALRGQEAPNELSYVAPELLMGSAADQRADVFTIGALMYYMATGHPPYQAESFPQLLGRMMMVKPADVGIERPDIGADAAATIMRCIASDAATRFSTAAEVTQAWAAAFPPRRNSRVRRSSPQPECGTSSGRSRCRSTQSPFSSRASWPSSFSRSDARSVSPAFSWLLRCFSAASNSSAIRPNCFACSERAICWL